LSRKMHASSFQPLRVLFDQSQLHELIDKFPVLPLTVKRWAKS
jgi:hypothetical protein